MLTNEEKKKALAYIRYRYPIGSEIYDDFCYHPYFIHKHSVYSVVEEDENETVELHKRLQFIVRDAGRDTVNYFFHNLPKNWVMYYYDNHII
jgi:L-amino acid N-acyltransferase YncA